MAQRKGGIGPLDPIYDVDTVYGAYAFSNAPAVSNLLVTINQASGQLDPTAALPVLFTAVFSRAVTGFATGDVNISGTAGASTGIVTEVAPFDGTTYQVAVSDPTGYGTIRAVIPAFRCAAVDDGTPNSNSTSTDNVVTYEITFDDEFCDAFPTPGPLAWDAQYLTPGWSLKTADAGTGFTISGGVASYSNVNALKEVKRNALSNANAYIEATNATDYTTGGDRELRLMINVGRDGTGNTGTFGADSYYYGKVCRTGGVPTIQIGKWWNGTDNTLATMALTVAVNDVMRVRHDGNGLLGFDVNGVEQISIQDVLVYTTGNGIPLRALGIGLGGAGSISSESVGVKLFCSGIWGTGSPPEPLAPDPWYLWDHIDLDTLTSPVLWVSEGTGLTIDANSQNLRYSAYYSGFANNYTGWIALDDTSDLTADQFVEITTAALTQVTLYRIMLRSSSTTTGYFFDYINNGSTSNWRIGILPSTVLVTSADQGSSVASGRLRVEAEGTALRLYFNGVLKISTTDGSIGAANNVRITTNSLSGQGIPEVHDIAVGNL